MFVTNRHTTRSPPSARSAPARARRSPRDAHLVPHLAQRVAQLGERDHLHVHAARLRVGGDEVDVGRRHPQGVEHPRLGGHHHLAPIADAAPPATPSPSGIVVAPSPSTHRSTPAPSTARGAARCSACSAYFSIPPVESMCTPSAEMSPAARNSITAVVQPHSGWIKKSAPGYAARVAAISVGRMPACTWHSPSHTCMPAELLLDVGAQPHVGTEQDLGVGAGCRRCGAPPARRWRRCSVIGERLHLSGRVHVHHDNPPRILGPPLRQLLGVDRGRQRAAGVEVGDQHGLLGTRIEAVSAMKCTPQKTIASPSAAAARRESPSESPT